MAGDVKVFNAKDLLGGVKLTFTGSPGQGAFRLDEAASLRRQGNQTGASAAAASSSTGGCTTYLVQKPATLAWSWSVHAAAQPEHLLRGCDVGVRVGGMTPLLGWGGGGGGRWGRSGTEHLANVVGRGSHGLCRQGVKGGGRWRACVHGVKVGGGWGGGREADQGVERAAGRGRGRGRVIGLKVTPEPPREAPPVMCGQEGAKPAPRPTAYWPAGGGPALPPSSHACMTHRARVCCCTVLHRLGSTGGGSTPTARPRPPPTHPPTRRTRLAPPRRVPPALRGPPGGGASTSPLEDVAAALQVSCYCRRGARPLDPPPHTQKRQAHSTRLRCIRCSA